MTNIVLDIETIPTTNAAIISRIVERENMALRAKLSDIQSRYVKDETIAKHTAEAQAEVDANIDKAIRGTALDGTWGEVVAIGYQIEGFGLDVRTRTEHFVSDMPAEKRLLNDFNAILDKQKPLFFIGHNVEWDLRFLYQRCVVHGLPGRRFNLEYNPPRFDTMLAWCGKYSKGKISLDDLCLALGVDTSKGDMSGKEVWDAWKAGRIDDIADYCQEDVRATSEVYAKMLRC